MVKDNLPGFTGPSGGGEAAEWVTESFDLSAYAGESILLSFRYVTDPSVDLPGWWIDDVKVGSVELTTGITLNGWATPTQIRPNRVHGFTVQLLAYTTSGPKRALLHRLALHSRSGSLSGPPAATAVRERRLRRGLRDRHAYDDPTSTRPSTRRTGSSSTRLGRSPEGEHG